jgi:hypothetical protein
VPRPIMMRFWRDDVAGRACLEYSWVPEGRRHTIQLGPGQPEATATDTVPDDLRISNVQVYTLDANQRVSTSRWQFPALHLGSRNMVSAAVEVFVQRAMVVGTAIYDDGSREKDERPLDPHPMLCPEGT